MSTKQPPLSAEFVSSLTEHQPDLWAYIISLMPGQPDVADVLQATNLVLWEKRDAFQPGTSFRGWAFTVARFEVLNHLKKQKRRGFVLLDEELLDTVALEAAEEIDSVDLRLAALEVCLEKLSPQDRDLLHHRYRTGHGLDDYARQHGRSVSSLSVTLYRLRNALRKCVNGRMAMEGGPL